ncbi:hypothetical protein R3P38DRAFT_3211846 [Favolaschia claudopus]|uniref:Uncharacterized protein n=1 Tax=Favolaschia claudopus TaxID=2862362 RepID=A0AAW0AE08_9AGAR
MFKFLIILPFIVSLAGSAVGAPIDANGLAVRRFRNKGQGQGATTNAGAQGAAVPSAAAVPAAAAAAPAGAAPAGAAPAAGAATSGAPAGSTECTDTDQSAAGFGGESPDGVLPPCRNVDVPFPCTNIQAVQNAFGTSACSSLLAVQRFPNTLKGTTECTPFDAPPPGSFKGANEGLPKASLRNYLSAFDMETDREEYYYSVRT